MEDTININGVEYIKKEVVEELDTYDLMVKLKDKLWDEYFNDDYVTVYSKDVFDGQMTDFNRIILYMTLKDMC